MQGWGQSVFSGSVTLCMSLKEALCPVRMCEPSTNGERDSCCPYQPFPGRSGGQSLWLHTAHTSNCLSATQLISGALSALKPQQFGWRQEEHLIRQYPNLLLQWFSVTVCFRTAFSATSILPNPLLRHLLTLSYPPTSQAACILSPPVSISGELGPALSCSLPDPLPPSEGPSSSSDPVPCLRELVLASLLSLSEPSTVRLFLGSIPMDLLMASISLRSSSVRMSDEHLWVATRLIRVHLSTCRSSEAVRGRGEEREGGAKSDSLSGSLNTSLDSVGG